MRLDVVSVQTVDLGQLIIALRRWYETSGDARPNQLLGWLASVRARNGGEADEQIERGLLLLMVQRHGPLEIPDPSGPPPIGLAETTIRAPYKRQRERDAR